MQPVLIGMNNPISTRPKYALWPDPPNCTGWRLWKMLHDRTGASQHEYIRAFDRRNLVTGVPYRTTLARTEALRLLPELQGRTVVLLGQDVCWAFRIPRLLIHPQELHGVVWRQLPHPSGRNLWYNDMTNRSLAGMLLAEMYEDWKEEQGEGDQRQERVRRTAPGPAPAG